MIFDDEYKVCNRCLLIFHNIIKDTRITTGILIQIRILIKFILKIQDSYYIDIQINLMAGAIIASFLTSARYSNVPKS